MRIALILIAMVYVVGCGRGWSGAFSKTRDDSADALQPYLAGHEYCQQHMNETSIEHGFYVSVPIDYSDRAKGNTDIYGHFAGAYDPSRPTYVLFTGGPGGHSHLDHYEKMSFYKDLGFNFLLFDQRGIACSRPATETLYRDHAFYSSENVARDFDEIRKFLKIEKVSVYGGSYGTAPATIYASLFPNTTKALVLEGILFSGFEFLFKDVFHIELIQTYLNGLNPAIRERIVSLSDDKHIPKMWFPGTVRAYLGAGGDYALTGLDLSIAKAFRPDIADENVMAEYQRAISADSSADEGYKPGAIADDELVNPMIHCKEFGATMKTISDFDVLDKGKVQPGPYNSYTVQRCPELGFNDERASTYVASNYPTNVPVTYFQGGWDGATFPIGAVKHQQTVPQGKSQLMILERAGHMPTGQIFVGSLDDPSVKPQATILRDMFIAALNGDDITDATVTRFNKAGPFNWTRQSHSRGTD